MFLLVTTNAAVALPAETTNATRAEMIAAFITTSLACEARVNRDVLLAFSLSDRLDRDRERLCSRAGVIRVTEDHCVLLTGRLDPAILIRDAYGALKRR